ncbi:DUF167 domain-containing protein [Deltaproteobacteria bacterium OttesenSCG-928-M10]|nr:DUF167 domain-containing protein [Deltaproteobacteria bacterium OttesenSCG-928-M10]
MSELKDICHLKVILSPRAKANALVGRHGEDLKIKIAAPPADGAANQALIKYLAGLLDLSPAGLNLIAGQTGRRKIVKIEGLSSEELWSRLNKYLEGERP